MFLVPIALAVRDAPGLTVVVALLPFVLLLLLGICSVTQIARTVEVEEDAIVLHPFIGRSRRFAWQEPPQAAEWTVHAIGWWDIQMIRIWGETRGLIVSSTIEGFEEVQRVIRSHTRQCNRSPYWVDRLVYWSGTSR